MILKTLLDGRLVKGAIERKVIYPYSGMSSSSIQYAKDINIDPYVPINNMGAFRSSLNHASKVIISYFGKDKNKIIKTVTNETGSPIQYHLDDMVKAITFLKKITSLKKSLSKTYIYEAKGNILLILSANEPLTMATMLIFSALFMGNTVFVKPSSKTPSFSFLLIKELTKIFALKNRVHFLLIDKEETERLIRAKSFDFVLSFGSQLTNNTLKILCAEAGVEFLQESEGNDWVYVDESCDNLEKVSRILINSFVRHNGQMCDSVRGIILHSDVYDRVVDQLKTNILNINVGSPLLIKSQIGSLIEGSSARINSVIDKTRVTSDVILNYSIKNNTVSPTLVINPKDDSLIISENIFAPVVWIKKVDTYQDAISLFREKNKHGLGFSIFSNNKKIINEFICNIRVGRLNINKNPIDIGIFDPWGGVGLSGRDGPSYWVEKISNRKYINI